MSDHNDHVAEMLRRVMQPVRMPNTGPTNDLTESVTESLHIPATVPITLNPEWLVDQATDDDRARDLGLQGLEKAWQGQPLSADEADISEAIILLALRPCIDVRDNSFGEAPPEWSQLAMFKPVIEQAIRATGRIELPSLPSLPYGGTGLVVGKNLMLTNRHVAELFTSGLGQRQLVFKSYIGTAIDFRQEVGSTGPAQLLTVQRTLLIHPYWDAALLQVEGLADGLALTLAANEPAQLNGRPVVVIGYPMLDSRNDIDQQRRIFGNVFGKKRLLPGTLMGMQDIRSFGKPVQALTHDSSTLGGNSGSLVLDLETGLVLGLHFAGRYMEANYAVPAWELANDPHLADVNFTNPVRSAGFHAPAWLETWDNLTEQPGTPAMPTSRSARIPLVADWFERTTTDELAEANQRNSDGTQALLRQTLVPAEADSLIAALTINDQVIETFPPTEVSLFSPRTDPNLPEIVFLHGIRGSHLAGGDGLVSRLWFNPLAFVAGNLAKKLTLSGDGITDAQPGSRLVADGHIRYGYERAARSWRLQGFVVHSFAFDWRKGVAHAADRLHLFLSNLQLERPGGKPMVLVAHSMGGLVAALYAQRHPEWRDCIGQAVLIGSPLRGSFSPIETVLGTDPFVKKLARLCRNDDLQDLRRMAGSMPGLLDMLPDPSTFADASEVYEQRFWPDHIVPQRSHLEQSLLLKNMLITSPLLQITTGIVSLEHSTVASLNPVGIPAGVGPATAPGDGTVPARSALIPGRANYKAMSLHAQLLRDPEVIQAVSDLIRTDRCTLQPVSTTADLNITLPAPKLADPVMLEGAIAAADPVEAICRRIQNGIFTQSDYDWLVNP